MRTAGVIAIVCGVVLVVALLLDWWGLPSAFEHPEDLPNPARFIADAAARSGRDTDADAFTVFHGRDVIWLVVGIAGLAWGLLVLNGVRVPRAAAVLLFVAGAGSAISILVILLVPPDYADLGPGVQPPVDLGVDLPLDSKVGGYIGLAAAIGLTAGAGLGLARSRAAA
jgi:hypothetical protein